MSSIYVKKLLAFLTEKFCLNDLYGHICAYIERKNPLKSSETVTLSVINTNYTSLIHMKILSMLTQ
jgi:hypothetical protein